MRGVPRGEIMAASNNESTCADTSVYLDSPVSLRKPESELHRTVASE